MAEGKLIGSRWGMKGSEVASADCAGQACVVASMLMRGPASLYTRHSDDRFNPAANIPPVVGSDGAVLEPGRFGIELDYGQGQRGGRPPFLRAGEQAKLIAINRATGYMGSVLVEMRKTPTGTLDFVPVGTDGAAVVPVEVVLSPPQLKITAKRQAKIEHGSTSGQERTYTIGFEGSALTSDEVIRIQTEWLDRDGSALPEDLPGFTGRLAMTVPGTGAESITLADGGVVHMAGSSEAQGGVAGSDANPTGEDRTGFFPVRPGKSTVVVTLPEGTIDMNHFYVHVDAQPQTRHVDFTGRPAPAGPSFSVKEVCYWTDPDSPGVLSGGSNWACSAHEDNQLGAGEGALSQRPVTYVPFLTAKYDKAATEQARRAAGAAYVEAKYQWLLPCRMQLRHLASRRFGAAAALWARESP